MGIVVADGVGQNPAKQVSLQAGVPADVPCTTLNKACASGMKTMMIGATNIAAGFYDIVGAGGMESMSNIPFLVPGYRRG